MVIGTKVADPNISRHGKRVHLKSATLPTHLGQDDGVIRAVLTTVPV